MAGLFSQRTHAVLLLVFAGATWFGCVAALISDVVGWIVVDDHNPINETISKLAVGKQSWIQDVGLDIFAGGVIACAVGLFSIYRSGWRGGAGAVALLLTAGDIFVIAEYNQYQGFDDFGGRVHMICVYILYGLVTFASVVLGFELRKAGRVYQVMSLAFAACWLVGSPLFLFVTPTTVDGAVERLLAVALVAWIGMLAWVLWQRGREKLSTNSTSSSDQN